MNTKWLLRKTNANLKYIAERYEISETLAHVLVNRNVINENIAEAFLKPSLSNLRSPNNMTGMSEAINKIANDISENKKIAVYGDYDVDGVMSSTILCKLLKKAGADVTYYLPHRRYEGYGMNIEAVKKLKERGVNTILTCDNGIASVEEINFAAENEIDVVIIDHHEPRFEEVEPHNDILPNAVAIVDPKQKKCQYEFKMLCAGGLCYKFALELMKHLNIDDDELKEEFLGFAAIATICDMVDLLDENRTIVAKGLEAINRTKSIGLKSLIEMCGLTEELNSYHIGFVIGPCINATGRLETAELSLELFLCEDVAEANKIAFEVVNSNALRKDITAEAIAEISESLESDTSKVLVVFKPEMHESIAGIVAGKIKEKYNKPVIMITRGEDCCKASGRSIEQYNLFEELQKCSDLLVRFGGHKMAAGLSIKEENIDALRKKLNDNCTLNDDDFYKIIRIDSRLDLDDITVDFVKQFSLLEPYGKANHKPIFAEKNVQIDKVSFIGSKKDTVKFMCRSPQGKVINALFFKSADIFLDLVRRTYGEEIAQTITQGRGLPLNIDFAFEVNINEYYGTLTPQMIVVDLRFGM